jgi:hypothetical protein
VLAAGDCPDGWFCEDNSPPQAPPQAPDERPRSDQPDAPPGPPPAYPPPGYSAPSPDETRDESQIYFDAPDNPPAKKRHRRGFREWGFNLHLETALLGNRRKQASKAGMAGIGFGFRYRPLPPVAFEAGVDLLTGTDFQGYSRSEAGLLLNTLVFFNPRDVVQLYGLGGFGFSAATVTIAPRAGENAFKSHDEQYGYLGAQLGLGVELRVTHNVAIAGDLIGFIRGRTDDRADTVPEFDDPSTHRATNASGGGLLRLGASFYW